MDNQMNFIDLGENVTDVGHTNDCRIMRITNETGEGTMTMYPVFDGVYIVYNNFHMKECKSNFHEKNILCIDHCREGRIETSKGDEACCYLSAGDMRIDDSSHNKGNSFFPLGHYYGMTIGIEIDAAEKSIHESVLNFSVNIPAIAEKYCCHETPYVISKAPEIANIFSQLYNVPSKIRTDYFRIKVLELLLYLDALEISSHIEERPYFYKSQVEKIRTLHKFITATPEKFYTIDELAARFDISSASLKKCFTSVYGSPVYTYMKTYRMNLAAVALRQERSKKISDIARSVGYENSGKFSVAFKSVMGRTPQEYRSYYIETEDN